MTHKAASRMCEEICKQFPLSPKVAHAISSVDRQLFVPSNFAHRAYEINALPMVDSQWISSPLTVAQMSEFLAPKGGDSVLEIGCGSGYQAMVLSKMFRRVFSIERIDSLLDEARARFRRLNVPNIFVKLDDGQKGWAEYAPFDCVLFSACARFIPQAVVDQLEEGGVLVAPMLEQGGQAIWRFHKRGGRLVDGQRLLSCSFVDVKDGVAQ